MPIPALLAAAPGLIKAGASLFGAGKRKRAEAEAQKRFDQQQANLENFQFENPYANQENVYEDQTVNQEQFAGQRQQNQQNLANVLESAQDSGNFNPQQFAQLAQQQEAGISQQIGQQERQNQQQALGEQSRLNTAEAQGAANLQQQQHGQVQQQFNLGQQNLAQAQQARQQATQDLVGGIAGAAGAFGSAHFDPKAVAGRQAARAAKETPTQRMKDNPLKRLYGETPFKQDPDAELKAAMEAHKKRGKSTFQSNKLAKFYGGEGSSASADFFNEQFEKYKQKHGPDASKKAFGDLYRADLDEEGGYANPYSQARGDFYDKNDAEQAAAIEQLRTQQSETFGGLDPIEQARRNQQLGQFFKKNEANLHAFGDKEKKALRALNQGNFRGDVDTSALTSYLERQGGATGSGRGAANASDIQKLLQSRYASPVQRNGDDKKKKSARQRYNELRKQGVEAGHRRFDEETAHITEDVGDLRRGAVMSQNAGSLTDPYNLNSSKDIWKSMGYTRKQAREMAKQEKEQQGDQPDPWKIVKELKKEYLKDPDNPELEARLLEALTERQNRSRQNAEIQRARGVFSRKKDDAPTKRSPLYRMFKMKYRGM